MQEGCFGTTNARANDDDRYLRYNMNITVVVVDLRLPFYYRELV